LGFAANGKCPLELRGESKERALRRCARRRRGRNCRGEKKKEPSNKKLGKVPCRRESKRKRHLRSIGRPGLDSGVSAAHERGKGENLHGNQGETLLEGKQEKGVVLKKEKRRSATAADAGPGDGI